MSAIPGKPKLKQHLNKFFSAIRKYRAVLASGSLAKPAQVADVLAAVQGVQKEITAFGQELAAVGAITPNLTLGAIEVHLDNIIAKLESLKNSNISANQNALKKLDYVTSELIRHINIKTEKEFKNDLKVVASKLGVKQNEIKAAVGVLVSEHPALTATASGQEGVPAGLQSLHDDANTTVDTIIEYTCVYVLMITVANPKVKEPGQTGDTVRVALSRALATLKESRPTNIFKDRVIEIENFLTQCIEECKPK